MVRVKIAQEGAEHQYTHRIFDRGALTWRDQVPVVNPRTTDVVKALLGPATDIRREGDDITAEVPDFLNNDDYEFAIFVNQIDRSTGRKGVVYIHSGEIQSIMVYPIEAIPKSFRRNL